jgi:hypothetical protein
MTRSPEEQAQRQRFEEFYVTAQSPVMLSIERSVCGCGYGGNSWTTQPEARAIAALLELRPGMRLLDVGAGSCWSTFRWRACGSAPKEPRRIVSRGRAGRPSPTPRTCRLPTAASMPSATAICSAA